MSALSRRERARRIRELIEREGAAVRENTQTFNARRYAALDELDDLEALRAEARRIKEAAIEDLPSLVAALEASVEANGGRVHHAADAAEARAIVADLLADHGAETVVKSKSMTTEEIDLNEALEADGTAVWETDLGEFVIQLADEAPSHITGPAIHRSRASIAELFAETFDLEAVPETADELTEIARTFLGERIREADAAITGANFLAARTGTVALVTSEGNARKCVATTPVHVAVAGVEKVVPTVDDLEAFVQLLARSATGQAQSAYLSLFTPPLSAPAVDFDRADEPIAAGSTERAFHLVLLDNGRFDLRDDEQLRETLYCIRCSACANSCANFQHVGGHAFGGETYSGGIAAGWETGVHGLESAGTFNDLCTGCTRCAPNCPVKIDIPWINTVVRDRLHREGDDGRFDSLVDGLTPGDATVPRDARLFARIDRALSLASALAPASNWLAGTRPVRALLERAVGVDARRPLPTVTDDPFSGWADRRRTSTEASDVVLYPDVYTEYLAPARGRAALRTLEALGLE
ncbi:MAG: LUD domain-containing protein, partial [Halobacteriales archaeon]